MSLFTAAELAAARGPLVEVHLGPDGYPNGATGAALLPAPSARVWALLSDVDGYVGRLPMIHRIKREGDRLTVQLRFRVSLFSAGFEFTVDAVRDEGRRVELRWVSGEPQKLHIVLELEPAPDDKTVLRATVGFDILSLGWLVKYFLKHHPEIRFGVFAGTAIALLDGMRRAI
jgi:carbon monoxide dehydrogenase subunit G